MLVEILDERGGKRRVRAGVAVGGEAPRQRRVGDQQRAVGLAHQRQPAKATAGIDAAARALREGIVAAGIEQHDLLRRRSGRREQLLERHGAERRLVLALDLHVGRSEHVLAFDLHAVAGIVDERDFGSCRLSFEFLQRVEQVGPVEIVILRDFEAVRSKRCGDGLSVGDRVVEAGKMLVLAHADDERHALALRGQRR